MTPEEWAELKFLFSPEGWRELVGDPADDLETADVIPFPTLSSAPHRFPGSNRDEESYL